MTLEQAVDLLAASPARFATEIRRKDQPHYRVLVQAKAEARARKWARKQREALFFTHDKA